MIAGNIYYLRTLGIHQSESRTNEISSVPGSLAGDEFIHLVSNLLIIVIKFQSDYFGKTVKLENYEK
ncbi:hypothetical protein BpHYR1_037551 [Brachionus plicatilis]|uniref:Uncharacterized protein n=1 Tax=Brachionus plicatilis TaxID=10195 RepID=A0A3M7QIH8_BRAPC|nr:hypothetical protein BpHYR1_037551 [Brachionus plicatilis]